MDRDRIKIILLANVQQHMSKKLGKVQNNSGKVRSTKIKQLE